MVDIELLGRVLHPQTDFAMEQGLSRTGRGAVVAPGPCSLSGTGEGCPWTWVLLEKLLREQCQGKIAGYCWPRRQQMQEWQEPLVAGTRDVAN